MASKQKNLRGPGRPKSGRKGFCVRMKPEAYKKLCAIAKEQRLRPGEWLEIRAGVQQPLPVDKEGEPDLNEAQRRFAFLADELRQCVLELHELVDLDPATAKQPSVQPVIQRFCNAAIPLIEFMVAEGVVRRHSNR